MSILACSRWFYGGLGAKMTDSRGFRSKKGHFSTSRRTSLFSVYSTQTEKTSIFGVFRVQNRAPTDQRPLVGPILDP